ncbi:MAG: hypothetical protein ACPLRA_00705, partial [Candidatus Saccharicenans sp.]
MKAKEIGLLVLIILVGVGFHYLQDLSLWIDDWEIGFPLSGHPFLFEDQSTLDPAEILEINNSHGSIQIEGSNTEKFSLVLEKKVWEKSQERAGKLAEEIKLITNRQGQQLILTTNRQDFKKKNFATNFRLIVPETTRIKVKNSFGLVRISKVKEVEVSNAHGQVEVFEISGQIQVTNSFAPISATDIAGACEVQTRHSSVTLSRIAGPVKLDCAHERVELFDLKSSLNLSSTHSPIQAARITGPSEITGSYERISVSESGPATIKAHHSPVEIDTLSGNLEIETSYEQIKLSRIDG